MFYVIELQTGDKPASIVSAFDNKADALEKFFDTAKYAVKSSVAVHSVMCVNAMGFDIIDPIVYEHNAE